MTDQDTIKQLKKQITRLRKRLLEKKKYEAEMLLQTGATMKYIADIDAKDQAALRED